MNEFFAAKLFDRSTLTSRERHASLLAAKLTKHGFESVELAGLEVADAHDDYVRAYADFWEFINSKVSKDEQRFPAWERYVASGIQKAMIVHLDVFNDTPSMGLTLNGLRRHSGEVFPLSRWASYVAKFRRGAKKLRNAVAVAQSSELTNAASGGSSD